jgi:phage gp45-like
MIDPIHLVLGTGKLNLVDDSGPIQKVQVQLDGASARDGTNVVQQFGLASNPPVGSDLIYGAPGGVRDKLVVNGSNHQGSRPRNTPPGGVKLYDQGGRFVGILNDGNIILLAPGETLLRLVNERFMALFNTHTHPANNTVPAQQMTATHLTGATKAGCP